MTYSDNLQIYRTCATALLTFQEVQLHEALYLGEMTEYGPFFVSNYLDTKFNKATPTLETERDYRYLLGHNHACLSLVYEMQPRDTMYVIAHLDDLADCDLRSNILDALGGNPPQDREPVIYYDGQILTEPLSNPPLRAAFELLRDRSS